MLVVASSAGAQILTGWPNFQGSIEQAVGSYSNGKLINANRLESDGPGFLKIFLPRDRGYGTSDWLEIMGYVTAEMAQRYPTGERLQIGDVSAQPGGPISGHASHQVGLDGDTSYYNHSLREQNPQNVNGFEVNYVVNGALTADFDLERNFAIARLLAGTGRLNRIFVNAVVKKALCAYAAGLPDVADGPMASVTDTLRRLRPWNGHDDHMHVRVSCPTASPRCVPQEEPPVGNGCKEVNNIKEFEADFNKNYFLNSYLEQHGDE